MTHRRISSAILLLLLFLFFFVLDFIEPQRISALTEIDSQTVQMGYTLEKGKAKKLPRRSVFATDTCGENMSPGILLIMLKRVFFFGLRDSSIELEIPLLISRYGAASYRMQSLT